MSKVTASQFRAALARLGLSQLGAARLFGADDRTARRWALGERGVPKAIVILLHLMLSGKLSEKDIADAAQDW